MSAMNRDRALVTLVVVVGVLASPGWLAATTTQWTTQCLTEGIQKATPQYARAVEQFLVKCGAKVARGKLVTDCVADLQAGTAQPVPAGAGSSSIGIRRLIKPSNRFRRALMKACAGPDGVAFTDDDVTLEGLDPGPTSGLRLHPWGTSFDTQMYLAFAPRFRGQPAAPSFHQGSPRRGEQRLPRLGKEPTASSFLQSHREGDCVTDDPVDVWVQKPGLQRLVDAYECLATTEGLATATKRFGVQGRRVQVLKVRAANPIPFSYDGGTDRAPLVMPDGRNDTIGVPEASGCPFPGLGVCAGDPKTTCALAPGSGSAAIAAECGALGPCIETFTGPDGVTAADRRGGHVGDMTVLITVADPTVDRPAEMAYRCFVRDVTDANGALVTTQFGGTCDGGPHAGAACSSSTDCDTERPVRYGCLSGDEYVCQCKEIVSGNRDRTPACGAPCLAALVSGSEGAGCGRPATATCAIARCEGGVRDGQACDVKGRLACPGGACSGLGDPVTLTGDEAGFFVPGYAGMLYSLCPFQHRWDFPFDLMNGTGWVATTVQQPPRAACLPTGTIGNQTMCYIHEPASAVSDVAGVIGFFTGPIAHTARKVPCPNASVPLLVTDTGLSGHVGIGPIVAVTGCPTP